MKIHHSLFLLLLVLFFSCKENKRDILADTFYDKGYDFYYKKNYDSSFVNFFKASQGLKEPSKIANSLIFLSIIQTEKGDFLGSNENLKKSTNFIRKNDNENLNSIYNQFAINHNALKNYKEAIYCYNKALTFTDKDSYSGLSIENNIGVSNLKIKNYNYALNIFNNLSKNPLIKDSIDFRNRVLDNLTYTKSLIYKDYNAESDLVSILEKRINRNDLSGVNASLSHLTDYFNSRNKNKALYYAKAMYDNSKKTGSYEDQLDALQKIIKLEDDKNIKPIFEKYQTLNDSIQNTVNNSKSLFTSIIYEVEKNKNEVLASQNRILKQNFGIIFLVLTIIIGIFWYRKRKKRLQQEKELEVKNTQLKMSKKVHDVVANGLYHMMVDVQNNPEVDKTRILNNIEKMYEESRDISHETIIEEDFSSRFVKMISSYSSPEQKVLTVGYNENIWENVSYNIQLELYYILREVLVNMKKHSNAKLASLKFEKTSDLLKIKYTDNGVGIENLNDGKGAGIHNTENRIESIGGDITFEKNPSGGLIIQITIPIH